MHDSLAPCERIPIGSSAIPAASDPAQPAGPRSFLPGSAQRNRDADPERVTAESKNGVLSVHVRKSEKAKRRQIEVKIG